LGAEVHVDERLTERAYGVWEGLVEAERQAAFPDAHAVWRGRGEPDIEGYEGHAAVVKRMRAAVEEWLSRTSTDVVMVTHGSSGRMVILDLLGLPTDGHAIGNLENAAWSRLARGAQGEWSLERHNIGASD
jgi:probable phosphoglycerate mutase